MDYPLERAGNVLVLTHPNHRGHGIASALLAAAAERWNLTTPERITQQRYSCAGLAFITKYLTRLDWRVTDIHSPHDQGDPR